MIKGKLILFTFIAISAVFLSGCGAISASYGVQVTNADHYSTLQGDGLFKCLDGKSTVSVSKVNDDYCDCSDGSDEPGTSACAIHIKSIQKPQSWKFLCKNAGFKPQEVLHNRINDGICDCCDGSDEYSGSIKCPNVCAEFQEAEEKKAMEEERIRQAGIAAKKIMYDSAVEKRESEKVKLVSEKEELKEFMASLGEAEQKLEPLKEKEVTEKRRLREEYDQAHDAWMKEQEKKQQIYNSSAECVMWRQTKDCDADGEPSPDDDKECKEIIPSDLSGFCECLNTETKSTFKYGKPCGHGDLQCSLVCVNGGVDDLENSTFEMDDASSYELPEARSIRDDIQYLSDKITKINASIKDIEARKDNPIGVEDVLRTLEGQCFTIDFQSYTYELCPFKDTHQYDKGGKSGPLMGTWKRFADSTYSLWSSTHDLTHMIFDNGDRCWNGALRATDVHVVCGAENVLLQIEEPSMCKYSMVFQTPAVCE